MTDHPDMRRAIAQILERSNAAKIACGVHIVHPSAQRLADSIQEGYRFIAYSIDAVFLVEASRRVR
jgi:2-dehydro-3-deoxyglucarate aldolase